MKKVSRMDGQSQTPAIQNMHVSIFNRYSSAGLFLSLLVGCGGFAAQQGEREELPVLGVEVLSIEIGNAKLPPTFGTVRCGIVRSH